MTIIDTTLYCDGELRLSRHGAGRGGNVLVHVPTGEQTNLTDRQLEIVERRIKELNGDVPAACAYARGVIRSCRQQPPVSVA